MTSLLVLDTETTAMDPEEAHVVEFAGIRENDLVYHHTFVKSDQPVEIGARATHHITDEEIANGRGWDDYVREFELDQFDVYVAHNSQYDMRAMGPPFTEKDWVCTYKCSKWAWPESERHSNQFLRYQLNLDVSDMPEVAGKMPHRALYDAWVTTKLFRALLDVYTLEDMLEKTKNPVLLHRVGFGKHRGELWRDLPRGYLQWITTQDFGEDEIYTARYYL